MSVRSNGVMKVRRTAIEHLAGDFVGLVLALEDLLAVVLDLVAAFQQAAQRLGTGDHELGVLLEEVEEPVLLGHHRLEPAEHRSLANVENLTSRGL